VEPLTKPSHLEPEPGGRWLARNPAGTTALAIALIGFTVVVLSQDRLWATPDWRLTVPVFAVTAIASGIAAARRERGYAAWLCALGLAAATLVLGWFLMLAIVVVATAALILILHAVM
jgi:hypothetical protein